MDPNGPAAAVTPLGGIKQAANVVPVVSQKMMQINNNRMTKSKKQQNNRTNNVQINQDLM